MKKIKSQKMNYFALKLGLDITYFLKGGFWLGISQIILIILGIITSSFFSRIWSAEMYGQYTFILTLVAFAGITSLPGMNQIVIKESAIGNDGILKIAIQKTFKWSLFGSIGLLLTSLYFYFTNNQFLSLPILILAISFPLTTALSLYSSFLNGKGMYAKLGIFTLISQSIISLLTITILIIAPSLLTIVLLTTAINIIFLVFFNLITFKQVKNNRWNNKQIALGKHLSLAQILTIVADYTDRFMVPVMLGFSNNAIYAFAILIPNQIHSFLKLFLTLGQPKIAQSSEKSLKSDLIKKIIQFEVFIMIIAIFYIMSAPYIFDILFPNYKQGASLLSQFYILSLLYFPANLVGISFVKFEATKQLYITNLIYILTIVGTTIIFIPLFGLYGAILAKIVGRAVFSSAQLYLFTRY